MSKLKSEYNIAKTGTEKVSLGEMHSNDLVSYFLRDVRGRPMLAEQIRNLESSDSFLARLEDIRTYLERRDLMKAKALIDSCIAETATDHAELLLEKARYYFFSSNFDLTIEILNCLVVNKDCAATTKMTAHEMLGQSYYGLDNVEKAIEHLKKATQQLEFLPYVYSGFVAGAHLVKLFAELKNFAEAKSVLNFLSQVLNGTSDQDIWISRKLLFLRALFHFQKLCAASSETSLQEAFVIASWLDDQNMIAKCEADFLAMGFVKPKLENLNFLSSSELLLIMRPRFCCRFDNSPILLKLFEALAKGPMKSEDLFLEVYGYPYDKERHSNHLRSMLSKLRKKLPPNFLMVSGGVVALKFE